MVYKGKISSVCSRPSWYESGRKKKFSKFGFIIMFLRGPGRNYKVGYEICNLKFKELSMLEMNAWELLVYK